MEPTAGRDEVHAAYRRAARRHHPDTGAADSAAMAAATAAWQVLGDPQRRMAYDRALRNGATTSARPAPPTEAPDTEPEPPPRPTFNPLARYQNPARFPWGAMAIMALLGIVFVVISVVTGADPVERPPDNLLQEGSCVAVLPNGDAAEVSCSRPHDAVVRRIVAFDEDCPPGEIGHRDQQGLGIACVVLPP